MIKKKLALFSLLALFSFTIVPGTLFCPASSAEETEVQMLQNKISRLEERIQCMEALVNEYLLRDKTEMAVVYEWENKKNWRKLEYGMTEDQVQKILGDPAKMIKGVRTLWYYPNKYCGYVSFDENGRLSGWNEP